MHDQLIADRNFQAVLDALPVPLAIHDASGNMTFLNRAFEKTFGYTTTNVPTLDVWWPTAYPDPEYRRRLAGTWQAYVEESLRTGRPFSPMEANVTCQDGSTRTIKCSAAPLANGYHLAILYDITEQKRIEDELRMTRVSVETSSDAIYWVAQDARIVDVNTAACESLGYPRDELLRMTVPEIDPHFTVDVWHRQFQELRQQRTMLFETEQRAKDGRLIPIEIVANYVRFGEQEFSCAFCRDISTRKEAERKLQESEERFKAFMDNAAPAVAWMKDDRFRMVYLSKSYEKLVGLKVADYQGKTDYDVWPPEIAERFRKNDLAVLDSGHNLETVEESLDSDGETRYWLTNKFPFRDAAGRRYVGGVGIDITARKRAEEELKASQEKYSRLVEGLGDRHCIFSHTVEGVFQYVSRNFDKLFGVPAEAIIGRDWRTLKLTPESLAAGEAADRRVIEERCMQTVELTSIHPDGSLRMIEITYGPVIAEGRVVLMEGICTDVTEARQTAADLAAAREAAEAANLAKSTFLANMSHELRTPITAIIGYTELLQDTALSTQQRNYLETISTSAETLIALVDDVLDLAKIEAGKVELDRELFSLRKIIGEVIGSQSPVALSKGLAVRSSVDGDAPDALIGDALRVKQVLLNLMGNAVKFTDRGEVTLSVAVEALQDTTVLLRFDVGDTGIGIKPEDISRIFQPFSQADASMTRKFGGTGLGLAICTQLCELLGGEIWVDSQEGVGSTFHIQIPFTCRDAATDGGSWQPGHQSALWTGPPLRVLLVEDNEISQQFFCEVLTRYGHHVDIARNGAEAVDNWTPGRYDMILMDLQMPGMDGFEAVRFIRQTESEQGGHIPVVALTARAMEEDRCNVLTKGFDGYVAKPMRIKDLFGEMRRCLAPGQAGQDSR